MSEEMAMANSKLAIRRVCGFAFQGAFFGDRSCGKQAVKERDDRSFCEEHAEKKCEHPAGCENFIVRTCGGPPQDPSWQGPGCGMELCSKHCCPHCERWLEAAPRLVAAFRALRQNSFKEEKKENLKISKVGVLGANIDVPAHIVLEGKWSVKDMMTSYNENEVFTCSERLVKVRDRWIKKQLKKGKKISDGPGMGLRKWRVREDGKLELHFGYASYFNIALHEEGPKSVLERDEMEQLFCEVAFGQICSGDASASPLPNRPQLALSVLTADNLLVVTLRSSALAVASGTFHASVVGGADPRKDVRSDMPIPFAAMVREADEELGITPEQITFRYFFLDIARNWQPGFAGFAKTSLTGAELLRLSPRDKKEGLRMLVNPDLDSVAKVIGASEMPAVVQLALLSAVTP